MRPSVLSCFLLAAAASPVLGQADGTYPATLFCEGAGGAGPVRESLKVDIANGQASYIVRTSGGQETGRGTLAGARLVLTGSGRAEGVAYTARYAGDVGGRGGTLTGRRTVGTGGRASSRACQLVLGDGRS